MTPELSGWPMIHLVLHVVVPIAVALVFYRKSWRLAAIVMIGTMIVDIDHLLADPVYDPGRCSIGFHPLHTVVPLVIYGLLFLLPYITRQVGMHERSGVRILHFIGLGLLIHMALDWSDCIRMMA